MWLKTRPRLVFACRKSRAFSSAHTPCSHAWHKPINNFHSRIMNNHRNQYTSLHKSDRMVVWPNGPHVHMKIISRRRVERYTSFSMCIVISRAHGMAPGQIDGSSHDGFFLIRVAQQDLRVCAWAHTHIFEPSFQHGSGAGLIQPHRQKVPNMWHAPQFQYTGAAVAKQPWIR